MLICLILNHPLNEYYRTIHDPRQLIFRRLNGVVLRMGAIPVFFATSPIYTLSYKYDPSAELQAYRRIDLGRPEGW